VPITLSEAETRIASLEFQLSSLAAQVAVLNIASGSHGTAVNSNANKIAALEGQVVGLVASRDAHMGRILALEDDPDTNSRKREFLERLADRNVWLARTLADLLNANNPTLHALVAEEDAARLQVREALGRAIAILSGLGAGRDTNPAMWPDLEG
jgi:hypothetical protein